MCCSDDWDWDRVGCLGGRHGDSGILDGTVAAVRDHRLRNRPRPAQFCRLLPLDSRLFRAGALLGAGVAGGSVRYSSRDPTTISFLDRLRSEEHTSELQSLMRISYAVFCLKKKP